MENKLGTRKRNANTERRTRPRRKGDDIAERLLDLGAAVIKLLPQLAKKPGGKAVVKQLERCGRADGANYEEARGAESPADFVHKTRIALKEVGRLPRRAHRRVRSTCGHLDRLRKHGTPTRWPLLNRDRFCVPCSPFLFLVPSLTGARAGATTSRPASAGRGQHSPCALPRGFAARFCKRSLGDCLQTPDRARARVRRQRKARCSCSICSEFRV